MGANSWLLRYENIEEYNSNEERKILTVFDDIITDILSNKNIQQTVTELFIRGRKINISLFYYITSFCCVKIY